MTPRYLLALCLLAITACSTRSFAPTALRSDGFRISQGTAAMFRAPRSVCVQFEPGVSKPWLAPSERRLQRLPACDTTKPSVRVAFFVFPTGCSPMPCEAPLSGYAVVFAGSTCDDTAQAYWSSQGGASPSDILSAFEDELLQFLYAPPADSGL